MYVEPDLQKWLAEVDLGPKARIYTQELSERGFDSSSAVLKLDHADFKRMGLLGRDIEADLLGSLSYVQQATEVRGTEAMFRHLDEFIQDWPGYLQLIQRENKRPLNARLHEIREAEARGEDLHLEKIRALDQRLVPPALLKRIFRQNRSILTQKPTLLPVLTLHETSDPGLRTRAKILCANRADVLIERMKSFQRPVRPACHHVLHGHRAIINSIAFWENSFASGCEEGSIRVWSAQSGENTHQFLGHEGAVLAVAMAGGKLLSGGRDHAVRLWDLEKTTCLWEKKLHEEAVCSTCLTPDGMKGFSGSPDSQIRVWDVATGECLRILIGHTGAVTAMTLVDGLLCSVGADRSIRLWNYETGECVQSLSVFVPPKSYDVKLHHPKPPPNSHTDAVTSVAAAGDMILTGCRDGIVRGWSRSRGACLLTLHGHRGPVTAVLLSNDGKLAVSAGADGSLRVWDMHSGAQLRWLDSRSIAANCLAGNGDLTLVASGGWDHSIRFWDILYGQQVASSDTPAYAESVAFLPEGDAVSGHHDGALKMWNRSEGTLTTTLKAHEGPVILLSSAAATPFFLSYGGDGLLHLWKVGDASAKQTFGPIEAGISTFSLHPAGRRFITGHPDGRILLWNADADQPVGTIEGTAKIVALEWMLEDGVFLSVDSEGVIQLHHYLSGKVRKTFRMGRGMCTACWGGSHHQNVLYVGKTGGMVEAWDFQNEKKLWEQHPHTDWVRSICLCDGKGILSAGMDGNIHLLSDKTGETITSIYYGDAILCLASLKEKMLMAVAASSGVELLKITEAE